MDLYLLKYNNYYNRIIKKEATLLDYDEYVIGDPIYRVNFVPNDGIDTEQIINWNNADPDYLLVVDGEEIVSRWFVMSAKRERGHQYRLILHRDVIADYSDDILKSTAYIKKALIPDSNPLIYNSEGMSFNQIKQYEDLLYDKTGTPWIVGYVAPNATDLQGATIALNKEDILSSTYEEMKTLLSENLMVVNDIDSIELDVYDRFSHYTNFNISVNNVYTTGYDTVNNTPDLFLYRTNNVNSAAERAKQIFNYGAFEQIRTRLISTVPYLSSDGAEFFEFNDKIVFDNNTSTYYRIKVDYGRTSDRRVDNRLNGQSSPPAIFVNPDFVTFFNKEYISPNEYITVNSSTYTNTGVAVNFRATALDVTFEPISFEAYSVTLHDTAKLLDDAPYKMFCMKYNENNYKLAINLNTNNGSKFYDVQLLPYCPVQDYLNGANFNPVGKLLGIDYEPITSGGVVVDYLFWADRASNTFDIPYTIPINELKVQNECDMYRLCSPNGNGLFEFNAAKNKGVRLINVDYTYRPYDPYIHLNPDFGGLYGQDFNDFRGLVLNGDFSIPAINDAWTEYTIQNKNYQNIFNREIQSMDLQHQMSRIQQAFNIGVGTVSGSMSGAITGGTFGGGVGAAVGGVVGGAASLGGGIADYVINEKLRADQKGLKQDLFSYNLQNIQALPQSISKTGCLTNNNKLVPYVEYYTCTDKERQVLRDKIKYQGMTVGAIGTINEFVDFGSGIENAKPIEADLIYLNINEDYHISMAIADELRYGVRFA